MGTSALQCYFVFSFVHFLQTLILDKVQVQAKSGYVMNCIEVMSNFRTERQKSVLRNASSS